MNRALNTDMKFKPDSPGALQVEENTKIAVPFKSPMLGVSSPPAELGKWDDHDTTGAETDKGKIYERPIEIGKWDANDELPPEPGETPEKPPKDKYVKLGSRLGPVAGVKRMGFLEFKNRHNEEENYYTIEVLMAGADVHKEMRDEQRRRISGRALPRTFKNVSNKEKDGPATDERWIQRVRIRSPYMLALLSNAAGLEWSEELEPRTFMRPFKIFIHFHPRMRMKLVELEAKWADEKADTAENAAKSTEKSGTTTQSDKKLDPDKRDKEDRFIKRVSTFESENSESEAEREVARQHREESLIDSREALIHLRSYIQFVDSEIIPLHEQFYKGPDSKSQARWEDLWYLFRLGEEVCKPVQGGYSIISLTDRLHSLWRVYRVDCPSLDYRSLDNQASKRRRTRRKGRRGSDSRSSKSHSSRSMSSDSDVSSSSSSSGGPISEDEVLYDLDSSQYQQRACKIYCYSIDFDGDLYGPQKQIFKISQFRGKRDIRSLPVFPLIFDEERQKTVDALAEQGRKFQECTRTKRLYYSGWPFRGGQHPMHIDSEVIVDAKEAIQSKKMSTAPRAPGMPGGGWEWFASVPFSWPTKRFVSSSYFKTSRDRFQFQTGPSMHSVTGFPAAGSQGSWDLVQIEEGVDVIRKNEYINHDEFLTAFRQRHPSASTKELHIISERDILLLPRRMFGYVLRDRKFANLDISRISTELPYHVNGFEDLKIKHSHKEMLKSLVATHFVKKDIERLPGMQLINQDIVHGKARGLVILLHGVPGVGKTATAEAVAQANNKALFIITCGDLGFAPDKVEESLTEIFRRAHIWDCVLLLDEADVFLSQRTKTDLQRNALVSVFLRTLEYYNGILFLTTNRVGALDEAFKSRIHLSLYYPPLSWQQTMDIFDMNIERLRQIDAQRSAASGELPLDIRKDEIIRFAQDQFDNSLNVRRNWWWNGRQIRNAFQIASSLSYYDMRNKDNNHNNRPSSQPDPGPSHPQLGESQFRKVADATTEFDNYMKETHGRTDAELAFEFGHRVNDSQPLAQLARMQHKSEYSYSSVPYSGHRPPPPPHMGGGQHHQPGGTGMGRPGMMASHMYGPDTAPSQRARSPNAGMNYGTATGQDQYANPGFPRGGGGPGYGDAGDGSASGLYPGPSYSGSGNGSQQSFERY
ncbi:uncharacterized protein BCR38DRAFT_426224 [Pseudomassariella vexata]|uniref:AAA+ ATPase domain-containing protein n=1 Tax=Pseudomassariella vexata TaxID=1141098 RepID=A0A1Y2E6G9_9PEZI|nr:uncharacterized protein BCR38DRAFT_426224 [Pseudomassariella vexata]ORY67158.1 hypothetical protein BCR38DRAFT_426224 [Pseudomassariella vexata]